MGNIFISTGCLENSQNVFDVICNYRSNGFKNIELGSTHSDNGEDIYSKLVKIKDCNFIVHNYFPPEKNGIVLNLGITDKTLLKASRKFILENLPKYRDIGAKLYSFHAPYRIVINSFEKQLPKNNIQNYDETLRVYFESLHIINDKAKKCGIRLAVENNEVANSYLVNNKNQLLTFVEPYEIPMFFPENLDDNIGALADIGHLKVSSNTLNFNPEFFIDKIKSRIFEIHINDNNGIIDQHNSVTPDSLSILDPVNPEGKIFTLEIKDASIERISLNYEIIKEYESRKKKSATCLKYKIE